MIHKIHKWYFWNHQDFNYELPNSALGCMGYRFRREEFSADMGSQFEENICFLDLQRPKMQDEARLNKAESWVRLLPCANRWTCRGHGSFSLLLRNAWVCFVLKPRWPSPQDPFENPLVDTHGLCRTMCDLCGICVARNGKEVTSSESSLKPLRQWNPRRALWPSAARLCHHCDSLVLVKSRVLDIFHAFWKRWRYWIELRCRRGRCPSEEEAN